MASISSFLFLKLPQLAPCVQQTEYNLNLVEPTGGSRREMKLNAAFEFGQPIVVFLMRRVIVQDHMDVLA